MLKVFSRTKEEDYHYTGVSFTLRDERFCGIL
jgi:hypothetical protein